MINKWKEVNSHIGTIIKTSIMRNIPPPPEITPIISGVKSAEERGRFRPRRWKEERNETDSRKVAEWSVKFGEPLQHLAVLNINIVTV